MGLYHRLRQLLPEKMKFPVALMYHRVASPAVDPWELSVSAENFEAQMQVLKDTGLVLPVSEMLERTFAKQKLAPAVCITFDDGYTDNYLAAKPVLEKYALPATFFIATAYTDTNDLFWWDELDAIFLLQETLPEHISVPIGDEPFSFRLGEDARLSAAKQQLHKTWMYEQPPPTKRCELYLAIWERLKPLQAAEIKATLMTIRQWAGFNSLPDAGSVPMTSSQVKEMALHSLFEIGIHTDSHCDLRYSNTEQQAAEINTCKETLSRKYGVSADTIAYPYGKYNKDTLAVVKDLQLSAAFTTEGNVITPQSDRYQAGRFQVKNWNGKEFEKQLRNWLKNS
ncbi:MAG: hypothetical protein EOO14_06305 [Chitinophagaceae bacterium]|nr:MAG: hypothetical protein EOO14_06305 [Chitinophagaceae bacterium]